MGIRAVMSGITIVALGDSTTAGTPGFKSPVEAPPNGPGNIESQYAYWLMQTHPDWQVLNRGVNGERSDQIRARFDRDVSAQRTGSRRDHRGRQRHLPGTQRRNRSSASSRRCTRRRAPRSIHVVAGTIIPFNTATPDQNARMHAVNDWIRAYAGAHAGRGLLRYARARWRRPGEPDRLLSSPDDLHPSPEGYRLMAAALEPAIKRRAREGTVVAVS